MDALWVVVGAILAGLLLMSWLIDRSARRRKARLIGSSDVWREVREGRRDAEVIDSGFLPSRNEGDYDWTSWNRRGRRRR